MIEGIVSDGVRSGIFRSVDTGIFASTLMLAQNAIATWWTPEHPRSPDEVADEILSYFLEGVLTREPAEPRRPRTR